MAKLRRKRKTRHSPAGEKHIKSMEAQGYRFTRKGKFVKTMATKGVEARLRRVSPELVGEKKKKEIEKTHLSRQTKKQLSRLSDSDYKEVMKMLKGKK